MFLTRENTIHIFKPPYNIFLLCGQTVFTNNCEPGNDVIEILTNENTENTSLGSRIQNSMNFTSGIFPLKRKISHSSKEDNPSILTNSPCLYWVSSKLKTVNSTKLTCYPWLWEATLNEGYEVMTTYCSAFYQARKSIHLKTLIHIAIKMHIVCSFSVSSW